jgi:hypothetical protein
MGDEQPVEGLCDVIILRVRAQPDGGETRARERNRFPGQQRIKDVTHLHLAAGWKQFEMQLLEMKSILFVVVDIIKI